MKIVLAPDSFKGSLNAPEACRALEAGARRVFPQAKFVSIPLADGGEGTLDALLVATGGSKRTQMVRGPLGAPVEAHWGILPDGRAVIEMAQASGLGLVPPEQRDALVASSFGTGQLIKAALDAGCRSILVGIGGSATTDGGIGALNALGLYARDDRNRELPPGGGALERLATLDTKFFDARVAKADFTLLCDVTNPLFGTNGAAHIYARQKGASCADIEQLDKGLQHLATVSADFTGADCSSHAGAGAGGGLAFGLLAFCNAQIRSGSEVVLEANEFAAKIVDADLIVTGEGTIDAQTLNGKTIFGACAIAKTHNVPVIAIAGAVNLDTTQMNSMGLLCAFSLTNGPCTLDYCLENAAQLLSDEAERVLRLWHR